jgi:hypothetical protein
MIKIKPIFFDGNAIFDDSDLSFSGQDLSITKLMIDVAKKVESLDAFQNPIFKGGNIFETKEKFLSQDIQNPEQKDFEIEMVFIDKENIDLWGIPDNVLGVYMSSSGAMEDEDQDFLAKKHRVVIIVDEDYLYSHIKHERLKQVHINDNSYDEDYLKSYLNTVTHELAHCLEWIENTNGISPSEIMNLTEEDIVDLSIEDIITGHGILFDFNEELSSQYLIDKMEERVESKGMTWLNEIELDDKLVHNVLNNEVLTNKKIKKIPNKLKR